MSVQKINLFEQVSQFYIGSQASIEATTGVQEGSLGYATDINKMGSYNGASWDWAGSGSGGHTIQDEGTPLTARTNLNFVGAGVTATDDSGNNATVVTIPGGGGSAHIIEDEGTPLTARANLNFIGGGVTATDNAGANSTDITIPAAPTQEEIEDMVGGMVSGNTETGIDVTYDDASGKLNFDAQTAGDLRYAPIAKGVTNGDTHDHLGGDGGAIAYSSLTGTPTILAFNDAEGNPSDDVRSGPADGTSTYAARRDHSHRDNLPPKFINRGTPTWGSSPVNDYDTAGVDEIIAVVGPGTIELTGMINGVQGNYVYLYSHNISTGNLLLKHLDGRSTVQFRLPGQQDMLISKSEGVLLQLQSATIWVVLGTTSGSLLQGVKVDPDLLSAATTNDVLTYDGSKLTLSAPSSGGHTIQEEGTPLTTRANLNFKGTGVTAADNSGANSTDVTVVINETTLTTTDITTGDVSTSKHGLVPKAPNLSDKYLDGTGAWSTIPLNGWSGFTLAALTRTGNYTFTVPGDYTTTFKKSARIMVTDSTTKFGIVLSSSYAGGTTTVTLFTNGDYTLAGNPSACWVSYDPYPASFPTSFSYTPGTSAVTLGNGTITGKFYTIGSQVFGDYTLTRGSTTSFTGNVAIGYPCTIDQNSYFVAGNVSLVDAATALYTGICLADGTVRCMNAAGTYAVYAYVTSTAPFTWGTSDLIEGAFRYRF